MGIYLTWLRAIWTIDTNDSEFYFGIMDLDF